MYVPGRLRIGAAWVLALIFLGLARPTVDLLVAAGSVAAVGLALRAWAAGAIDKGAELAVRGPYAHTRNPLYLGSFVTGVGVALAGGHWGWPIAFASLFVVVYVPTMRREARELADRFGDRYRRYAAHVPSFAVRLTPYRASARDGGDVAEDRSVVASRPDFTWSRYLRYREWEAALGVLAILGVLAAKVWIAR